MSKNEFPSETWSLERLGSFCNSRRKRMAEDAWWIGRAIQVAKAQAKHGEFTAWKRRYGFSDAVASRYMRLCEKHKSPDEIKGRGLTQVLVADGILPPPKAPVAKNDVISEETGENVSPQPAGPYSWEADKPDSPVSDSADQSGERLTVTLRDEQAPTQDDLGAIFVSQMSEFRGTLERLMELDCKERAKLWHPELFDAIKNSVVELAERLDTFEWCMLMDDPALEAKSAA